MDTFTAKLGLRQYDPTLFYDVSKISADNLLVDNAFGTIICTSTTRPSTGLFNGMQLWETDTRRFVIRVAGAWVVVPVRAIIADATARAAITTPYDGMMIYRQDRDWHEAYDGAAWRVVGVAHCASTADRDSAITNPYSGQIAMTQDSDLAWTYDSANNQWRYALTNVAVGGKRRTTSSVTSGTTELQVADTGSLALIANSLFEVRVEFNWDSNVAGDHFIPRFRDTNVSGTVRQQQTVAGVSLTGVPTGWTMSFPYTTTTAETKTFVATIQRLSGTGTANVTAGTFIEVIYKGASSLYGTL